MKLIEAPKVETSHLILRGHRAEDLPALLKIWSDPVTVKYIGGAVRDETTVWRAMLTQIGHWKMSGYGYWAVEEKNTGRFVGEIGFADFHREPAPVFKGVPEMGWVVNPEMHGKGYAPEAIEAAKIWAWENLKAPFSYCLIDEGNGASLRVAEKTGFKEVSRSSLRGLPTVVLRAELGSI